MNLRLIVVLSIVCLVLACTSESKLPSTSDGDDNDCDPACPDGFRCVDSRCRLACETDSDCPEEIPACEDGLCVLASEEDGDLDEEGYLPESDEQEIQEIDDKEEDRLEEENETESEETEIDQAELDSDPEVDEATDQDEDQLEIDIDPDLIDSSEPDEDGDIDEQGEADEADPDPEEDEEDDCPCPGYEPCCEFCQFLPPGTLCEYHIDEEYRCMPEEEDPCDAQIEYQILSRVCLEDALDCTGPIVGSGRWLEDDPCDVSEMCTTEGCVEAEEECCECSEGACCSFGCRFTDSERICETISEELGCPWGEEPGSDTGIRGVYQYCPGDGPDCTGEIVETDWELEERCYEFDHCSYGLCTGIECNSGIDCYYVYEFYCREGQCIHYNELCYYDSCTIPDSYCSEVWYDCLPLAGPCRDDEDCPGHPAGTICDETILMCRDTKHCSVSLNNCYSGTECRHLDEFLGYEGDYCVECENDEDCYPDLHCEERLLMPNVCTD